MIKVTYYFRKRLPIYHSIEELFTTIKAALSSEIQVKNTQMPRTSNGFSDILKNILFAHKHQSAVNHITGDVHYIALLLKKRKTILTIHDLDSIRKRKNPIKQLILKLLWFQLPLKKVRYVTVISEFTKQQLLEYVNFPEHRIKVIPNCVSEQIRYTPPKKFSKDYPRILHIGTTANKNLPNLLKALKGIPCHLTIIGVNIEVYEHHLEAAGVDYENYSNQTYQQIIEHYQKCDIVSFISLYEGFGLPIIEAQATGRPVITSNRAPMNEVAGNSALLVNPEDVSEMRKGILQLIENKELRNELIQKGTKNVQRFKATTVAAQYADLYREIALK